MIENDKIARAEAKKEKLTDLVNYQKGSVVSRTIIDKTAGTVTLFAFDQRQGLSEHTAPFDALVYLLDGAVEITISGKVHRLKEGEIHRLKEGETIMLPANHPHALKALSKFKMLLIMIRSL
jgi:quercetin dioxygenase-like cupin family protein